MPLELALLTILFSTAEVVPLLVDLVDEFIAVVLFLFSAEESTLFSLLFISLLFCVLEVVILFSIFVLVTFVFPISWALASLPKNINAPIATEAIPKLNFLIPYLTILLSNLCLSIFPPYL